MMNNVHAVVSKRKYEKWPSWFVVYEYEDIIAKELGMPIELLKDEHAVRMKERLYRHLGISFSKFSSSVDKWKLIFVMSSEGMVSYTYPNCIPFFLDTPAYTVNNVIAYTKKLPFFFVSCLDFFSLLKKSGCNNVHYIPLSVSDQYITDALPKKKIDVIQVGRKNYLLHEWMLRYCEEHKEVEYVYKADGTDMTYSSTMRGDIGKFESRSEYMEMLKLAKVSLVSTPGCDGNRDFGGIDFVTPRFYESAACYCQMVGRYSENAEIGLIGIKSVCSNVSNYDEFSHIINVSLRKNKSIDIVAYKDFLKKNCTSQRAKEIKRIVTLCQ